MTHRQSGYVLTCGHVVRPFAGDPRNIHVGDRVAGGRRMRPRDLDIDYEGVASPISAAPRHAHWNFSNERRWWVGEVCNRP